MKLYGKSGRLLLEDSKDMAFSKMENGKHFVREYRGVLFDPFGIDSRYSHKTQWRPCSERCLDLYNKYLQNKKNVHYRLAEREFLTNG